MNGIGLLATVLLNVWFVAFTDKAGVERIALSEQAIALREQHGIAIDAQDYAVSDAYLDSLRQCGGKVLHTSRWLNGATVVADSATAAAMARLACVQQVECTRTDNPRGAKARMPKVRDTVLTSDYGTAQQQLELFNLPPLHAAGFRGQGIRVGVADGSFARADTLPALEAARSRGWEWYDFTDDSYDFFSDISTHGTVCWTLIAAQRSDYQGAATESSFYVFRTEENDTESPKEMDNWVAAVEAADSIGIHILSTSLGYTTFDDSRFDLDYLDMDGRTTRAARAAATAAHKGMLLVTAAGNDGNNYWHYLSTPADADSTLTVGAVDADGNIAAFSSFGPTADGRIKPEVCAMGQRTAIIEPISNTLARGNGTSFACPLIAGLAACLWSALPDLSNMQIRRLIIQSADQYAATDPDPQRGYGIPDAWQAYQVATGMLSPSVATQPARVVWCNGQIFIEHNGTLYDILARPCRQNN